MAQICAVSSQSQRHDSTSANEGAGVSGTSRWKSRFQLHAHNCDDGRRGDSFDVTFRARDYKRMGRCRPDRDA